jgi:RNA polymerase sigma-70 factor (ECF subfamily)
VSGDLGDEAGLWDRSLGGDAGAFAAVFDQHRDRVFGQAARLLEGRDEAEDVAASAFLELWRRRFDVRLVGGSVLPWLLVTTSNLARNSFRARRRYRSLLAQLPREERAPDAANVALEGAVLGIDPALRSALRSLPEQDLHLLSLVVFEDLSLADAAAVLHITESAAKARLYRVRHRVRGQLGDLDTPSTTQGGQR